ncbi:DUF6677 family protein [Humisphaera borealis]|uniref:DUF6677 domain-containing protein n=1 Tax=Humisphaera borealis TaxID=2807512 RepID=A0A7M2WRF4_9BACT|nr:DUF6677 family protein [Humisphaera borealis]QOV88056.1 hypothetical protein IPV69_17530 [Humisphaera borealis]
MNPSETPPHNRPPHPLLVALAAWALPGLGYALIGQRTRGITVGVTIVLLFVSGLLVGGVRSLEVPTVEREEVQVARLEAARNQMTPPPKATLGDEIRAKPWSITQFFNGPVGFVGAYFSARASTVDEARLFDSRQSEIVTPGVESHARVNEIAVLYTAVAGMLNLLVIIDSAHRAGRMLEER